MSAEKCESCKMGYGIELDRCHGYNHANAVIQRVQEVIDEMRKCKEHDGEICDVCLAHSIDLTNALK